MNGKTARTTKLSDTRDTERDTGIKAAHSALAYVTLGGRLTKQHDHVKARAAHSTRRHNGGVRTHTQKDNGCNGANSHALMMMKTLTRRPCSGKHSPHLRGHNRTLTYRLGGRATPFSRTLLSLGYGQLRCDQAPAYPHALCVCFHRDEHHRMKHCARGESARVRTPTKLLLSLAHTRTSCSNNASLVHDSQRTGITLYTRHILPRACLAT